MVILFRSVLSVLIIFLIAFGSYADDKTQHIELLSKHFRLMKPEGKGPFPAVMLVPVCSGFDSEFFANHYERVQDQLVELGFVALRIDSLAVRNKVKCHEVDPESVAGDIGVVVDYLRQQNYVKKSALNVLGWSSGGAWALQSLRETQNRNSADVNAVIVYYPECWKVNNWDSEVPVLALFGGTDIMAPFADCEKLIKNLKNPKKFTYRLYDDAHHGFDNPDLPPELKKYFGTVGYNESAAMAAWSEVTKFLKR